MDIIAPFECGDHANWNLHAAPAAGLIANDGNGFFPAIHHSIKMSDYLWRDLLAKLDQLLVCIGVFFLNQLQLLNDEHGFHEVFHFWHTREYRGE